METLIKTLVMIMDELKITRRFMTYGYGILFAQSILWYQGLAAPTNQQTALLTVLTGILPAIIAFYNSKRTS